MTFPDLIHTDRLLLRPWTLDDAPQLKRVLDANVDHLHPWIPWATPEPAPEEVVTARVDKHALSFTTGSEWLYGVFSKDGLSIVGGAGLHPRIGAGGVEIGYWISVSHIQKGYATEAAATLTRLAFEEPSIERVQIRCDPRNVASAAIPRRLGFDHIDTIVAAKTRANGEPYDLMVWEMTRSRHLQHVPATIGSVMLAQWTPPTEEERATQLLALEHETNRQYWRDLALTVAGFFTSTMLGLYLVGWALHTTSVSAGRLMFWGGLILGNAGWLLTMVWTHSRAVQRGDA